MMYSYCFVVCSNSNSVACFWAATNSFSASFCELRHSGFSSLCPWQILVVVVFVGPCPVRFLLCFSAGWRSAYLAGGSAFRPLRFGFVVSVCVFDLPTYMTTGVHVDVILTCFFSYKDRASERHRPHQRKKNETLTVALSLLLRGDIVSSSQLMIYIDNEGAKFSRLTCDHLHMCAHCNGS